MSSRLFEEKRGLFRGSRIPLLGRLGRGALLFACCFAVANLALASFELDAMKSCQKSISKEATVYAKKRLKNLLRCFDLWLECDLPQEREYEKVPNCLVEAKDSCASMLDLDDPESGMNMALAKFTEKVERACHFVPFADILDNTPGGGGLWYSNDAVCGGASDPNSLFACLSGRIDQNVDEMVARNHPRVGLFLDNAGIGSHYPAFPRPPKQVQVITANDGDLVNPGTISIAAGTAVEFYADPNTVSCGGGAGGGKSLTIQVGTAGIPCSDPNFPVMQEREIHEPYGPANVGIVGPFEASLQYCLQLEDDTCTMTSDEEFGDIIVP